MELRFRDAVNPEGLSRINAFSSRKKVGHVDYYELPNGIRIDWIEAMELRKGIGTGLLRALVERIGPDIPISACVVHEPTLEYLQEHGFFEKARLGPFSIVEQQLLSPIPIVGLHQAGYIRTTAIEIADSVGDEVEFKGISFSPVPSSKVG